MSITYTDILYSCMRQCENYFSIDPNNLLYFLPLNQIYLGTDIMNMYKHQKLLEIKL